MKRAEVVRICAKRAPRAKWGLSPTDPGVVVGKEGAFSYHVAGPDALEDFTMRLKSSAFDLDCFMAQGHDLRKVIRDGMARIVDLATRMRKLGERPTVTRSKKCSSAGCLERPVARGMCRSHYVKTRKERQKEGTWAPTIKSGVPRETRFSRKHAACVGTKCKTPDAPHKARGLCMACYGRRRYRKLNIERREVLNQKRNDRRERSD